jgi:hypothetical protein
MKLKLFRSIFLFAILIFITPCLIFSQSEKKDSVNKITMYKYYLKSSFFLTTGEIPLYVEFRKNDSTSFEISAGYVFADFILGSGDVFCNGLKVSIGLRNYLKTNYHKKRQFYLNPQIFHKEIWADDRDYSSDGPIIYGGGDNYDRYSYNLHRKVTCFKLSVGWVHQGSKRTFVDYYLGIGIRLIIDDKENIKWQTSSSGYPYNPYNVKPKSDTEERIYPSFHMGLLFSFGL